VTKYHTPNFSFHPGSYLQELLVWQGISPEEVSSITEVPKTEITNLIAKRRGVDKTISEVLAAYFSNSSKFWLDLQEQFDHQN
jgi:plasmid maintenance system antidote protein VapI